MIDLIRRLLDRPLDPRHARAIIAIASCLTLTFAGLVALGALGGSRTVEHAPRTAEFSRPTAPPRASVEGSPRVSGDGSPGNTARPKLPDQDPQDRRGSAAYSRAHQTLRESPALQHLPFRGGGLSITLVGADRGRAVIRIAAATIPEAKRGWIGFLRRLGDDGSSYEARFQAGTKLAGARPRFVEGFAGGFAGPFTGRRGRTGRIRHHKRHRGPHAFLKSPPHPKASP